MIYKLAILSLLISSVLCNDDSYKYRDFSRGVEDRPAWFTGNSNAAPFSATKNGGVDIHFFDVGQGMSQLIVFPSGFTILADCAELTWNKGDGAALVASKLASILGTKKTIDVAVLSHLHLDHVGYAGYGGFWALIEKHGYRFKKFIDRDSGSIISASKNCSDSNIKYKNMGVLSGTGRNWICYATNPANKNIYDVREIAKICSKTQIAPKDNDTEVVIVAGDAYGATGSDGKSLQGDHRSDSCPSNENDFSVGFLLRYKKFTYGFFGDLDGEYHSTSSYCYNDIEKAVLKRLAPVDAYNVNHHGSQHSTSAAFANALQPTVSVISAGKGNSYGHPTQDAVDRILPYSDIYLTEDANPSTSIGTKGVIANGDILLSTSADGASYSVTAGKTTRYYYSKGSKFPTCKK